MLLANVSPVQTLTVQNAVKTIQYVFNASKGLAWTDLVVFLVRMQTACNVSKVMSSALFVIKLMESLVEYASYVQTSIADYVEMTRQFAFNAWMVLGFQQIALASCVHQAQPIA